jgi:curli biogenesis system outer membrane secretion channel CsgG
MKHVLSRHGSRETPWLAVIGCLLGSGVCLGAAQQGLKKRVAVVDMTMTASSSASPGGFSQTSTTSIAPPADFASGLTEILTTELVGTGKFLVLERTALSDIVAEQDLMAGGKVNKETGARSGAIIGAQALIRCAITEYSNTQSGSSGSINIKGISLGGNVVKALVGIDTRIYDATTSEILASVAAHGTATTSGTDFKYSDANVNVGASGFNTTPLGQASRKAIAEAVHFIVTKLGEMPWEARVVRAQGRLVYLNAGEESGVAAGQVFEVFRPEEALVDPASGTELGSPDRRLGSLKVTAVKPKYSVGQMTEGDIPKRNDVVRQAGSGENP